MLKVNRGGSSTRRGNRWYGRNGQAKIQERSAVPWSFLWRSGPGARHEDLDKCYFFCSEGFRWCVKWMRCSKDGFVRICSYRRINREMTIKPSFWTLLAWATGTLTGQCWGLSIRHTARYVLGPLGWMGPGGPTCDEVPGQDGVRGTNKVH